ncbi:winged helix-turn-helix transcriptional regulator [Clostridium grantii]|uniref:Transcriptional regulator, HxlR family n=1 Tax=Clostridium grantii DSM 8605 TaxID=1121316 RepID=A0A1M5XEM5_9CLOT|nr:helix-turn-helix domain-containing protein [Clostridium grantii]SHH98251.1 transcriptional regulator, HxlR family [Clostridium grantii DSM 8605]
MGTNKKMPECPVEATLLLIGNKWKVLILRDLMNETMRFNELMRSVTGITQKVLTSQLRDMEKDGLLSRKIYPVIPPKVEYSLTNTGRSLKPILDTLATWGEEFKQNNIV